ncbi:MAG: putative dipeptidyl-peptidase 5 [Cirrosporium novae-zelandiae]|nr:MAG: putative dipeptidyl-peptidase 5 [Cirrosporium novae-zelandiae]
MGFKRLFPAALAILPCAFAITPEQMLSAPRRSEAVPNPSGDIAFFSVSQYSFDEHDSTSYWALLDLKTGDTSILTNDSNVSEIIWLGSEPTSVLYINGTNEEVAGGVELWISDIDDFANGSKVASIPAPLEGLKAAITTSGDINFVLWGDSYPNGTAYNEELVEEPLSSARIYDSIYIRHWDYYLTPEFQAVFSGILKASNSTNSVSYTFDGELTNLVAPVKYAESPYPPFGGSSDYDLSPDGTTVVFMSKAPEIPKANYTTSYIYLVPHNGSQTAFAINGLNNTATPPNAKGASSAPIFSPDGTKVAYFQMDENTYESDRNKLYIASLTSHNITGVATNWDRSPDTIKWANNKTLYVAAADYARERLFVIPTTASANYVPTNFTDEGVVSSYYILPDSSVLVTSTSIWSSVDYYIATTNGTKTILFAANEVDEELSGLGPEDVDEFYYEGNWTTIQSWIVKPEGFTENKTYPLAFLIHGGPQGDWANSWSTRWNLKVFADQGYIVIAPNPTGSTSFGELLTDKIQNDWGGAPYYDLMKAWEYARDNISYVDTDPGVALGASYGGFMINWIQGSPLGREFQALVTHDGVFSAEGEIGTEELWFMQHDFNGTLWDNRENYERFSPSRADHLLQYATPHLVIHNELDYRLPISEGIGLFNVLQERGVPSRFLSFPDENHWVTNQENSLVWHQQVLGWVNKYSGIAESNPDAVTLADTTYPVVDIDP